MKKVGESVNQNALSKSYLEALKEEGMKEFLSHISLPDEELMKYTSTLLDSKEEYDHCRSCKNLLSCQNKVTGYCYLPRVVDGNLIFEYHICKYQKKKEKEFSYLKNVITFEEPKEIKEASMKEIYTDDKKRAPVIKWLVDFLKKYPKETKGLYLHGNFGCGKTYLVSAMFHELAKKEVKSAIVFWPEFLRDLKGSFKTDFQEKFHQIKKVPLLLIDDIGAESTTPWERDEILSPLLQYRMQEHLPTFFTSNLNLEELEKHFSTSKDSVDEVKARRIMERVKQLTEDIELNSKNLRN